MKKRTKYTLTAFAVVILATFAFTKAAVKSKVGHLHTNALWELMPEKKVADSTLLAKRSSLEKFFQQKQEEFKMKVQQYTADSANLSGALKEQRLKEIVDLNKSLEEMPQSFEKDLNESREKLYQPIRKKMQVAVDKVAEANGFDYIIDSSYGTLIFSKNESDNIMNLVKKQLNIPK